MLKLVGKTYYGSDGWIVKVSLEGGVIGVFGHGERDEQEPIEFESKDKLVEFVKMLAEVIAELEGT